jgi:23S rRNA (guanosine2251-2'-O)-methyltransferase
MKLYGKRSVYERVRANPKTIRKILVDKVFSDTETLNLARKNKVRVEKVHSGQFYKFTKGKNAQGIIAEVEEYNYDAFDEMLSLERHYRPIMVFLDGLTDPQNLGSIIRTYACLGGFCLVLPKRGSVDVNETVLRVASGGENYVPICQVSNLGNSVLKAKKESYSIGATVAEGGKSLREAHFQYPVGLILGSEGSGIRPILEKYVDYRLTIPMCDAGLSFNVAVSAAIFGYELACRRVIEN